MSETLDRPLIALDETETPSLVPMVDAYWTDLGVVMVTGSVADALLAGPIRDSRFDRGINQWVKRIMANGGDIDRAVVRMSHYRKWTA